MPTLENLLDRAIEQAAQTGTLSDIAQAAGIAKSVAEEQKARDDVNASKRGLKPSTISAITVMLSVLGLVATSVYNIAQLAETRNQIESSEWRDLLVSLDKPNVDFSQSVTVPFRLRSFATSKRFSQDARLVGARVVARIADAEGFKQLFMFIFADQQADDLTTMLTIQSELFSKRTRTISACEQASTTLKFKNDTEWKNLCWGSYSDKDIQDFGVQISDTNAWRLRKNFLEEADEIAFMSPQIARALRSRQENGDVLKFGRILLLNVDLSSFDFSHFDISGTTLDNVVLSHAKLTPAKFDDSTSLLTTNWWDADLIDKRLLQFLIDNAYPSKYWVFFSTHRPTRLEYHQAVLSLCHKVDLPCTEAKMPYEEDGTGLEKP